MLGYRGTIIQVELDIFIGRFEEKYMCLALSKIIEGYVRKRIANPNPERAPGIVKIDTIRECISPGFIKNYISINQCERKNWVIRS